MTRSFGFTGGAGVAVDGCVTRGDAVGFGKLFISNPDLPARFASSAPLTEPDRATFYGGGAEGYTDYPALAHAAGHAAARAAA